ncbi:MAG: beta-lactamase family protein, partial [Chloroflexota bacterium]|nr:beta-lactamase family protein [Chloroflexota bacterium]
MTLPTERLEAIVREKRAASGAPGIAVGVVARGELAWFLGSGWADLDRGTSPSEHSLARVASVTKTFTATAVLQLRDRGLLSLEDPLELHLPEFGEAQERGGHRREVTIRALLTHRSGLVTESPGTSWDGPNFPSMAEILAALPRTAVVIPRYTIWKYSNLGFALLGEVVARRSGQAYVDYLQSQVFEPLGLTETA